MTVTLDDLRCELEYFGDCTIAPEYRDCVVLVIVDGRAMQIDALLEVRERVVGLRLVEIDRMRGDPTGGGRDRGGNC